MWVRGRGMPTLLTKTGQLPRAPALGTRPVFLPLKTAPPIWRRRGFEWQSEGRHNITHYTLPLAKCVPRGLRTPLETPEKRLRRRARRPGRGDGEGKTFLLLCCYILWYTVFILPYVHCVHAKKSPCNGRAFVL